MKKRLKFLDQYLSLWILLSMAIGIAIGNFFPTLPQIIDKASVGTSNYPIAICLILMMYAPLTKINLNEISNLFKNRKLLSISLFITWIIGPFLMFLLSVLFFSNHIHYQIGLILIGIAPCIAMVVVWSELAGGNKDYTAGLVGINSLLQILLYSSMAYFYITYLPPFFGIQSTEIDIHTSDIAKTVGLYLGLPFVLAQISRTIAIKTKGETWFKQKFIPFISPMTLIFLLLIILLMFSLKGKIILELPLEVLFVASSFLLFFCIMFLGTFWVMIKSKAPYEESASIAFTASGNNFELAIAVAIGIFGINSQEAFVGVIGPLVEVPVLLTLVKLSLYFKKKYYSS
jgi:ACR3 family arsenite transporter